MIISMFVIYPVAMNKDFLNGKSIGKRIFGIQVQNLDGQKANEWKCSLRNILPIIPIDILFTLMSPKRRIGDRIAKTQIGFENQKNLKSIGAELKNYRLNKELFFGIVFGIVNIYGLLNLYGFIFKITTNL
ncbi:RDD family protein [Dokdonia sp. 4H-3-7-5]|uniref:RDD family protein n=1 Tax=Dokdonia sp. (strain 4H-3-7-5) TaxID=983548 RepID=UPI00030D4577